MSYMTIIAGSSIQTNAPHFQSIQVNSDITLHGQDIEWLADHLKDIIESKEMVRKQSKTNWAKGTKVKIKQDAPLYDWFIKELDYYPLEAKDWVAVIRNEVFKVDTYEELTNKAGEVITVVNLDMSDGRMEFFMEDFLEEIR